MVITGTWGSGKTSLIESLAGIFSFVPEPARAAIAEDPALLDDWATFSRVLLSRAVADFEADSGGVLLFDRGIPDCLAYARWFSLDEGPYLDAAVANRYEPDVLICPPWAEIYTTDDLRKATFDMATDFHDVLATTYVDLGYRLTEVPLVSLEERGRFVETFIAELP